MRVHALFAAGLLGLAPSANAQVSGTIIIGGGPVGGVITVGQPVIVARPRARVVYVEPRVVYVERWRGKGHFKHGHGYAKRYVYYDPRDRVYYDGHRKGCHWVEVWERRRREDSSGFIGGGEGVIDHALADKEPYGQEFVGKGPHRRNQSVLLGQNEQAQRPDHVKPQRLRSPAGAKIIEDDP